jgi:hypothetical protein
MAHPAGGTNTTPPEELERDVKKVTMEEMRRVWWAETSETSWNVMKPLITRYTDQAVEEATVRMKGELDAAQDDLEYHKQRESTFQRSWDGLVAFLNYSYPEDIFGRGDDPGPQILRLTREVADLREQLDRALVPRFKVGDKALLADVFGETRVVTVTGEMWIECEIEDGTDITDCLESSLAPLETETKACPLDHRKNDVRTSAFRPWEFCPLCGASLTKETP